MLRTRLTQLFGIKHPVISAPMANHSGGRLAAAVTSAGGLGLFGGLGAPEWLCDEIEYAHAKAGGPFGVGFITAFLPRLEAQFRTCIDQQVPVLVFSFGDPTKYVLQAKEAGLKVMCQVQTVEGVRLAVDAGADVIIAQGSEAGGHSGELNTLPCLLMALEAADGTPVVAAGGIASGPALAAVLAAGGEGVMMGTAFMATPEAVEVPATHKDLIVASDGQDTVHTRVFDILGGAPWPQGIAGRVRVNSVTREWHDRYEDLQARRDDIRAAIGEKMRSRDPDHDSLWMGQSAAFVKAIRPAAEIVREVSEEAERILRERPGQVLA